MKSYYNELCLEVASYGFGCDVGGDGGSVGLYVGQSFHVWTGIGGSGGRGI